MITEQQIENNIEKVNQFDENNIDPFIEEQEDFLSYIKSEIAPSLLDHELRIFMFCISVIYNSIREENDNEKLDFDIEDFDANDEINWGQRDKSTSFEKSKDILFEDYEEEDLLAFIEDLITNDENEDANEDEEISDVGKEIIFLNAKSYIDTLTDTN